MRTTTRLAAVLMMALFLTACGARSVRIAELQDRPGRYTDDTISVTGTVTSSWGIPLLPYQFYNVDDGSGEITVLSRSGRVPSKGTRVQVKGRLSEIASFGTRSVGLHIDERDRKIKG